MAGFEAMAGGFDAIDFDARIIKKRMEQAHGVRTATNAGDQRGGQPALGGEHLLPGFRPITDWKSRTIIG